VFAAAIGATSAHAAIVDLLRAAEAPTRRAAVCALAQLYEEGDFDALFGIARADPDESVRRAAAWMLRTVAVPSHWRPLFDAWVEDALPRHRVWACELVAAYGDEAALTRIEPLSRDGDGHVRKAARGALRGPA
jgi:HEAT repeat protein